MALGALDSQAEHAFPYRIHAVKHRIHPELLRIRAALFIQHGVAEKSRRHLLVLRRLWQQVPGELFDNKLVVGEIAIKGVHHPVAVAPNEARLVLLEPIRVRITRGVQPVASLALPVVWGLQQLLHDFLIGIWRRVVHVSVHLLQGWREADQIKIEPPQHGHLVRWRRGIQPLLRQTREDERIDWIRLHGGSACGCGFRHRGADGCLPRPMVLHRLLGGLRWQFGGGVKWGNQGQEAPEDGNQENEFHTAIIAFVAPRSKINLFVE